MFRGPRRNARRAKGFAEGGIDVRSTNPRNIEGGLDADDHDFARQQGPEAHFYARAGRTSWGPGSRRRSRLHSALHSGARRPRDHRELGLAAFDARRDRGHARGRRRRRERVRRDRRGHFWRHSLRPNGQAGRLGARHRRRAEGYRRGSRVTPARLVARLRRSAFGRPACCSSVGKSRSAAAASRSIPTISLSPTPTASS